MARILALETSSDRGSVALLDDDTRLIRMDLPAGQRSARSLVPTMDRAFCEVGWKPADLQLIAVTVGPGSFTGLRVGVTTAKALAYANATPIAAVNTLDVVARQGETAKTRRICIMDAQRQQLYVADYARSAAGHFARQSAVAIVDLGAWLERLAPDVEINGPALAKLRSQLPSSQPVAGTEYWHPDAAVVGQLGWEIYQRQETVEHWTLVPEYMRISAAEEKLQTTTAPEPATTPEANR